MTGAGPEESAVLRAVANLLDKLSTEQIAQLATGEARIVFLPPGHGTKELGSGTPAKKPPVKRPKAADYRGPIASDAPRPRRDSKQSAGEQARPAPAPTIHTPPSQAPASQAPRKPGTQKQAAPPLDLDQIAAAIPRMTSTAEVLDHLNADKRLTVPVLKQLAAKLGITIPSSSTGKEAIQRQIAEGAVGYRVRSAAVREGSW